jgi:indole-3-glycerol phosphate synthase
MTHCKAASTSLGLGQVHALLLVTNVFYGNCNWVKDALDAMYFYQLYKMRLAGADAVNILVGALAAKDLVYFTRIAKSFQMQSLLTVTLAAQLEKVVSALDAGIVVGLIVSNGEMEDSLLTLQASKH